jgi:hydrogenase maturation protein HypF
LAERCKSFAEHLRTNPPPLARINQFEVSEVPLVEGERGFVIHESEGAGTATVLISPDVAICADCRRELSDPSDPRYRHPFINCTNCGPRYSIIQGVPYDRPMTTMSGFPMCRRCEKEYHDPANRRFHAQPVCCPDCGPHLMWFENGRTERSEPGKERDIELIARAVALVASGRILAVKGLGGYHLACDATTDAAVCRLRERKHREEKPLAVMFRDVAAVEKAVLLSDAERLLLQENAAPIVLCLKRADSFIAQSVAPGNARLGVFLPYTPLHILLLSHPDAPSAWVMTSGNQSDEPIAFEDEDALARLGDIADAILFHNRPIHTRIDDSVVRLAGDSASGGKVQFLRRSRGYVPVPIKLPVVSEHSVLAAGADLKNALCLTRGVVAFLSHHIGDLENDMAYGSFHYAAALLAKILEVTPDIAACDLHPDYYSARYVREEGGLPYEEVQHHHAHAAALLAEHGLSEAALVWCCDGTGYGIDGTTWGCELLLADLQGFVRLASLRPALLPGADAAVRAPWRQALARLAEIGDRRDVQRWAETLNLVPADMTPNSLALVLDQIAVRLMCPASSGLGRLFDSVAALLEIKTVNTFEGQAPMCLEDFAASAESAYELSPLGEYAEPDVLCSDHAEGLVHFKKPLQNWQTVRIDPRPMLRSLLDRHLANEEVSGLALAFHHRVAEALASIIVRAARTLGVRTAGLSGGCFVNRVLESRAVSLLTDAGMNVILHHLVPPNDGGIALGQAACAHARLKGK